MDTTGDVSRRVTSTRVRSAVALLGPAFVAAVAYADPGNVAANISAGARFGYLLVWVIVAADVMAGLVQYLSAKLGLVTGRTLPEMVRDHTSGPVRLAYWAQAETVAMATDLAEVVGGAIALNILFGLPLIMGGVLTGFASLMLLVVQSRWGQRPFERLAIGLLIVVALGFLAAAVIAQPSISDTLGGAVPRFQGTESMLLAAAITGATVMPHAVYLHSGLVRDRHGHPTTTSHRTRLLRVTRGDVAAAMLLAGAVNLAMLLLAARTLHGQVDGISLETAHAGIRDALGPAAGLLLAVGLLASGIASTSVGAYAGAMIMQGLLHRHIALVTRRLITLVPAFVVLTIGIEPTRALIVSQVILSFGIPFALIPLVRFTGSRRLMGTDANHRLTTLAAWAVAAVVTALNVVLLVLTVTGS
ncbi:Nramp family divalent metal transporter [Nocardia speluncae]|uniref:Nramp family divalent metal transporter n=1 Tax=Nocardia speluncae TaxID=419477 RepID=A0A846XEE7_9NOCA|nr:Nramp family divalent metal transporter [Nocardia speluncae]NKY32983.1 Nramp family divalent metal transporter [Nocardia speluncae]